VLLHLSKLVVSFLIVLVSLLPAGVFATPVSQQGNFKVSVTGTTPGSVPHDLDLKVTQIPGGQLSETTGFAINPESVVQVKQGENIIVTTSENLKVNNVKAKNVQGQQIDLLPLGFQGFLSSSMIRGLSSGNKSGDSNNLGNVFRCRSMYTWYILMGSICLPNFLPVPEIIGAFGLLGQGCSWSK
jgi:hypothetical protein